MKAYMNNNNSHINRFYHESVSLFLYHKYVIALSIAQCTTIRNLIKNQYEYLFRMWKNRTQNNKYRPQKKEEKKNNTHKKSRKMNKKKRDGNSNSSKAKVLYIKYHRKKNGRKIANKSKLLSFFGARSKRSTGRIKWAIKRTLIERGGLLSHIMLCFFLRIFSFSLLYFHKHYCYFRMTFFVFGHQSANRRSIGWSIAWESGGTRWRAKQIYCTGMLSFFLLVVLLLWLNWNLYSLWAWHSYFFFFFYVERKIPLPFVRIICFTGIWQRKKKRKYRIRASSGRGLD